jgi:hypothetical protein
VTGVEYWRHGEPDSIGWPHRFALHRWYDRTGQSGTGIVAYGTVYPSGRTTLAWCCGDVPSVVAIHAVHPARAGHAQALGGWPGCVR